MNDLYNRLVRLLLAPGSDKYLHLLVCQLTAFALAAATHDYPLAAILTMFVAVVVKETVVDLLVRRTEIDWRDVVADTIGTALGLLMAAC